MHALVLALLLVAPRALTLRTYDGREVKGVVVMETSTGLLVRTEAGNVLVKFEEIASAEDADGAPPAATSAAPAGAPASPRKSPLRLGLSAGVGAGPGIARGSSLHTFIAAEFALLLDLDFGRLGLRFSTPLTAGALTRQYDVTYFKGTGMFETQLRLNFSPRFSSGLGFMAGVLGQTDGLGAAFSFGPTVTFLAVRLGSERSHELSFNANASLSLFQSTVAFTGAFATLEYALLF